MRDGATLATFRRRVGGLSSAGRAVALQASGHRFDPDRLHQSVGSAWLDRGRTAPARRSYAATNGSSGHDMLTERQPRDEEKRFAVREHGDVGSRRPSLTL